MNNRINTRRAPSNPSRRVGRLALWTALAIGAGGAGWAAEDPKTTPDEVFQAAIDAMGGPKYLAVKNAVAHGRYFFFRKDRKAFAKYSDWTVYEEPIRSRFQLGKGKNQTVQIYNLGLGKGWTLEGEHTVEEVTEEDLRDFKRTVKKDLDYILRTRRKDPDIKLFYYGPDEVAGAGRNEAVELLDADNDSVVIFFDVDSHLPVKIETGFVDKLGFHHKEETEFFNWHWIDGVYAPLRYDTAVDGDVSQQRFLEELAFNQDIPASYFLEPVVKEKKK